MGHVPYMEFLGNAHPPTRKPLSNWGEVMCQTKPSTYSLHPPCSLRCQLSVERGKWKRLSPNRSLRSTGECRLLITFSAPQVKRLFNPHVTCCNLLHQESTIISTRVCIKIRDTSHATTRRNIDKSTQAARKGIQTRLASSRTVSCRFSGTTGARVGGFGRSSHTEPEEVRLGGGGSVLQGVGSPQSVTPCRLLVGVAVLPGAAPGVDGVFDGFLLLVTSRRKSAKTYHINMDNMDIYIYIYKNSPGTQKKNSIVFHRTRMGKHTFCAYGFVVLQYKRVLSSFARTCVLLGFECETCRFPWVFVCLLFLPP